jgi:hypothetical protein
MRKGLQVLTPLIVGALIVSGSTAIAAVKAGSACSKAGITSIVAGKKFTCVKSGKKLVWNKGITVKTTAKPKATPEATASPTATSNPTLRQVWETISSESLAVWDIIKPLPSDLKGGGSRDITFAFSSDIPADSQEELKRQYRFTTTYWARFTPINQRLHVAVSKLGDVRFLCTERAKYIRTDVDGCVQYNPGPVIGAYTMFDDRSGTFNWMTIEPELKNFGTHEGWTSHHEYVHSVQYSVNKLHWETHPCWFEEGMAMLFSPALYSEGKLGLFLKLRNQQVRQNVGPWIGNPRGNGAPTVDDWSNWLWRATITKYDKSRAGDGCSNFSGSSPETGIYHVGQIAVEKVIQKVGMAGLFKLMTLTGEQGWASAVKAVFGVTDRELNLELAQVIHRETLIARNNSYLENFCTDNPKDPDC